jgi:hypothetical protein
MEAFAPKQQVEASHRPQRFPPNRRPIRAVYAPDSEEAIGGSGVGGGRAAAPTPVMIYDFGQNMAGAVEVELGGIKEAAAAAVVTTVRVRHAELLFPNGSLWHHYPKQREELHYTVRADGSSSTETFAPLFSYMGFRYVEVTILPEGSPVFLKVRSTLAHVRTSL